MAVTFSQIKSNMTPYRNPNSVASNVEVVGWRIEGWVVTRNLLFRSTMKGQGQRSDKDKYGRSSYLTLIMFNNVTFTLTKGEIYSLPVNINGETQYAELPNLNTNTIRLKCTCPDFRFRFEKELYDVGGIIGNWNRYKKVPGSNRGPVNPDHRLGYCKHVYSLLKSLKIMGYVKE